jgi:uncharacterized damage-inducible protein DinB
MDIQLLSGSFRFNEKLFNGVINDISHGESLQAPNPAMNPINWIVGHIVFSREQMLSALGLSSNLNENYEQVYQRGSVFSQKNAEDFGDVIKQYRKQKEIITEAIDSNQTLDQKTWSKLNTFLLHESYHIGQIGTLRKYLGKDRIA